MKGSDIESLMETKRRFNEDSCEYDKGGNIQNINSNYVIQIHIFSMQSVLNTYLLQNLNFYGKL